MVAAIVTTTAAATIATTSASAAHHTGNFGQFIVGSRTVGHYFAYEVKIATCQGWFISITTVSACTSTTLPLMC